MIGRSEREVKRMEGGKGKDKKCKGREEIGKEKEEGKEKRGTKRKWK